MSSKPCPKNPTGATYHVFQEDHPVDETYASNMMYMKCKYCGVHSYIPKKVPPKKK